MIPSESVSTNKAAQSFHKAGARLRDWMWVVSHQWSLLHVAMGFLLGRAVILQELSPFSIPFFTVMFFIKKNRLALIAVSLIVGGATQSIQIAGTNFFGIALALAMLGFMEHRKKSEINYAPIIAFLAVLLSRMGADYITNQFSWYQLFMNGVDSVLGLILTLIFVQALPIVTSRRSRNQLKSEEIICLIILLASVMTGTVGWLIQDVAVDNVLSRYLVLLFAAVGGGTVGSAVGVVTGLVLSLANIDAVYQISLLAFSGLLAGLLREGNKLAVGIGLLIGSSILTVYVGQQREIMQSTFETVSAIVMFFLTPRGVLNWIGSFIPGTEENIDSQQQYLRRIRDVTAGKMNQFAKLFSQLSDTFNTQIGDHSDTEKKQDYFLSEVTRHTCQRCWKKDQCWERQFDSTYQEMTEMMKTLEEEGEITVYSAPKNWLKKCIKQERVFQVIEQEYARQQNQADINKQIAKSRLLVADQLAGVSRVMQNFASEVQKEGIHLHLQEEQILSSLESMGLSIRNVDILNLEEGKVDIEISQPSCNGRDECVKVIAPLLSDIVGEKITVKEKNCQAFADGFCTMCLGSAQEFEIETGVAGAAKGGQLLSGDCFKIMELGNGKMALAMSDGMGNGERAYLESSTTLDLLEKLLESGMEETLSIKSVNTVLSLRSPDEIYATVDLALVDLHTAKTKFIKTGSTPSFIKRGNEVIPLSANNLPIGIIDDIDVDVVSCQLKPGDLLIMMTDGIYDAARNVENKNLWMKRKIAEIKTNDPQEIADLLLELVIRHHYGEIIDDMTVMVTRIDRYSPAWATIPVPNAPSINRPRYVS
ncbi:stage II sporulation protein E [Aneurinibacillus sp. Ricciae_BoGa-3]|uniref:stage II sporulation protein E n=1 Tax=Aneurinibacillus sp. Ricciae_BoGa-3 TaxID=3022697 RepID=UPI002341AC33|nr:stage II sporulation protein E [Aneurinibacillus sp. Ricciae_BoGa-3]WCK54640.1 stage II sporulation protein E [Aneurinibacillus sp. Ricciae_BoGa-3]